MTQALERAILILGILFMFIVGTAGTLLPGIHKSCREEDGKDSDLLSRQLIFLSVSHIFFAERRKMVEKVPKKRRINHFVCAVYTLRDTVKTSWTTF